MTTPPLTTLHFQTHVSDSGVITLPPLPDSFRGEDIAVKINVGREREPLSETEEQRRAAGQKFFDTWNGLLEGMPDMTMKEIRAERLERRHGK